MAATPGQALGPLLATLLLVLTDGKPSISLKGPPRRMIPENSVPFICAAGPFSSRDLSLTWVKDSDEHPAPAPHVVPESNGFYSITSKAWVTLAQDDVLSKITCKVAHGDLKEPLQMTMNLSQVIRVIPTVKIITKLSRTPDLAHQTVNLTCHASHFYPPKLQLTWMKNGHKILTVTSPWATRNPDGTYSLEHTLQEEATLDGSKFTCWVVQDNQPPVGTNITLTAQASSMGKGRSDHSHHLEGPRQRSAPGMSIQLRYTSSGFQTHQVTVTWLKNSHELPGPQTSILPSGDTYNVTSSVRVLLKKDDIVSSVLCLVQHRLSVVFQKVIGLNQYLRVSPVVTVSQSSTSSGLASVICHVQRFYPPEMYLTWLEDCHMLKRTEQPMPNQNEDGSYTLKSFHLVNTSVHRSEQVLTCKVEHEAQPPIQASLILSAASECTWKPNGGPGSENSALIFVAFLLGLKVLLLVILIATYISRWWNL